MAPCAMDGLDYRRALLTAAQLEILRLHQEQRDDQLKELTAAALLALTERAADARG